MPFLWSGIHGTKNSFHFHYHPHHQHHYVSFNNNPHTLLCLSCPLPCVCVCYCVAARQLKQCCFRDSFKCFLVNFFVHVHEATSGMYQWRATLDVKLLDSLLLCGSAPVVLVDASPNITSKVARPECTSIKAGLELFYSLQKACNP